MASRLARCGLFLLVLCIGCADVHAQAGVFNPSVGARIGEALVPGPRLDDSDMSDWNDEEDADMPPLFEDDTDDNEDPGFAAHESELVEADEGSTDEEQERPPIAAADSRATAGIAYPPLAVSSWLDANLTDEQAAV